MRDLFRQTRSEIRLLPFMLGKLAGGTMAALGTAAAVVMLSNRPGTTPADALPYAVAAVAGIAIFAFSSRMLARRLKTGAPDDAPPSASPRMSLISWLALLLLAAGFLLVAFLLGR